MIAFAALLERLAFTTAPAARRALLRHYFTTQPDPTRGFALAAMIGVRLLPSGGIGLIHKLAAERTDPVLLAAARDFVGDLTETLALMWPAARTNAAAPGLATVVATLRDSPNDERPGLVAGWLDASDPPVRLALLKLIARRGQPMVPGQAVWEVLAECGGGQPEHVEAAYRALAPPFTPLFAGLQCGAAPIATIATARTLTAVLLYAEPGAYTVGVWRDGTLVPVGKAEAADAEAALLDGWVRAHSIARFGTVREVEKSLVLSVAFGSVRSAPRRKSGMELRAARIVGVLPEVPAADADTLEALLP